MQKKFQRERNPSSSQTDGFTEEEEKLPRSRQIIYTTNDRSGFFRFDKFDSPAKKIPDEELARLNEK